SPLTTHHSPTMGTITFLLPPNLAADAALELERAGMIGGQDGMPYTAHITVEPKFLHVGRRTDESGYLIAPWDVEGAGRLMVASPTVIEREQPYQLQLELARGKVNQVRGQAAEWLLGGLVMPPQVDEVIRQGTRAFCRAVSYLPTFETGPHAQEALVLSHRAA